MINQEIADELALSDHLCSFLYGTPEYWRYMARRVEQMRPTCDVEATADADEVRNACQGYYAAQIRWEDHGDETALPDARLAIVRAVLAHVHPQPREKGTTFGPDADSYNHVFGCESPPRADDSAPQQREEP